MAVPGEPDRVVAETGPPILDTTGFTPVRLWPRAVYEDESLGYPLAVAPERDPAFEDEAARYGTIGGEAATIVTFVILPKHDGGRVVIVDQDRDGDLKDDPPHAFERTDRGLPARFDLRGPRVPLALSFPDNAPDWARDRVFLMTDSTREGVVSIGDSTIRFSVRGSLGAYGRDYERVTFDTNGNGVLDSGEPSDESYRHSHDSYVNLAGRSWSFEVGLDGSRLTLTALDENRPDRPGLADGNPRPISSTSISPAPRDGCPIIAADSSFCISGARGAVLAVRRHRICWRPIRGFTQREHTF